MKRDTVFHSSFFLSLCVTLHCLSTSFPTYQNCASARVDVKSPTTHVQLYITVLSLTDASLILLLSCSLLRQQMAQCSQALLFSLFWDDFLFPATCWSLLISHRHRVTKMPEKNVPKIHQCRVTKMHEKHTQYSFMQSHKNAWKTHTKIHQCGVTKMPEKHTQ